MYRNEVTVIDRCIIDCKALHVFQIEEVYKQCGKYNCLCPCFGRSQITDSGQRFIQRQTEVKYSEIIVYCISVNHLYLPSVSEFCHL